MTYDPSMTITSTIPAPEGSDSTSREGKAIPLPVMESKRTSYYQQGKCGSRRGRVGGKG